MNVMECSACASKSFQVSIVARDNDTPATWLECTQCQHGFFLNPMLPGEEKTDDTSKS